MADALQPLIVASTADADPIAANNTDAAACACSEEAAGCPSHTPSAAHHNTCGSHIGHMHTLRVFVVSRAFADGFDLAANAGCPPVAAHADPAPSTFLASAAAADVISTLNPASLSPSLAPDGDGAPSLALDPSLAPAIPPLASKSEPPLASNSEFRSAGFLQRVCDGLMHTLQPVTQLLVEIIPLSLPTDVMDARCFVRQVPNQPSRAAAAKSFSVLFCSCSGRRTNRLIASQCDPAVSHVQTVLLFLDDGHGEADHIPSSVRCYYIPILSFRVYVMWLQQVEDIDMQLLRSCASSGNALTCCI